MKETKNYKLKKPDYTDVADIADINGNMDLIDKSLYDKSDKGHTHNFSDLNGGEIKLINTATSSEGYFLIANWRYTTYDRFALVYHKNSDSTDTILLEWTSTGKILNVLGNFSIKGNNIETVLENKAELDHKHTLAGSTITGTLPISKGGTGAVNATAARTNLGLGAAALKGVATVISSGNTNLVTSGAVYNAINNLNNRTHIVIATYDTKNPLKVNADYTCTGTNATSVLKQAINAVAKGGRIELLDGTYNLQYSDEPIELSKDITIEGAGYITTINQPADEDAGEAKPIFIINGQNVRIKSIMLCDKNVSSPVPMILQQTQGAIYDDIFFILNSSETSSFGACIRGANDCNYTRIQNCRVFKGFNNNEIVIFDFGDCTNFGGVIGGNISSGYNNISVKFASEGHKNNTAIYGHSNIDLMI